MGKLVSAEPIPPLRPDLEVGRRVDGVVDVRDPRLLNVYSVDAAYFELARYFDGRRGAAEIRVAARGAGVEVEEADVVEAAEVLEALLLLDTPAAREAEPSLENAAPHALLEPVERRLRRLPVVQPDGRWSCHACGACCHGLAVELSEAEEARIDPSLYRDVLGDEPFAVDAFIDPELPARRILRQRQEPRRPCIFLGADGLCLVHARQGMEAKPDACQIFPYTVVHLPKAPPRLALRTNCHTMHETWVSGAPAETAIPDVRRILETHASQKVPKEVRLFGAERPSEDVVPILDRIADVLEEPGATPGVLARIDREHLDGRARKRRRAFGRRLAAYARDEREGPVPVEEGGLWEHLSVIARPLEALEAMSRGRAPPSPRPEVARFLGRQARLALHGLGPFNLPDAGVGLVALILATEATLHAVGEHGRLPRANRAFMAFTAPILENTAHAWPVLDAIDPDLAATLRATYAETLGS